jgi:hypothetical protein
VERFARCREADEGRRPRYAADLAGGDWPERARKAAIELSGGGEGAETAREMLLSDLRDMFDAQPSGVLFVREILAGLVDREDRPWSEWKLGKPITGRQLAALLKPLGVTANQTVRRSSETAKGYEIKMLADAFARYSPPSQSVTRSQVADSAAFDDSQSVTPKNFVTDEIPKNSTVSAGCDRVTDPIPPFGNGKPNGADSDHSPEGLENPFWMLDDPEHAPPASPKRGRVVI